MADWLLDWLTVRESTGWLIVDRLSVLLSFVVLSTIAGFASKLFYDVRRKQRRDHLAAELAAGRMRKPVALVLSFHEESIEADVRRYLTGCYPHLSFPSLPAGADEPDPSPTRFPIVTFHHSGTLSPDVALADLERLRATERWLKEEGFTEVHLFLKSTVAFGCAVGALFTNWGAVHVYHRHPREGYEYWFPLSEVKRGEAAPDLSDALAELLARRLRGAAATTDAPSAAGSDAPG